METTVSKKTYATEYTVASSVDGVSWDLSEARVADLEEAKWLVQVLRELYPEKEWSPIRISTTTTCRESMFMYARSKRGPYKKDRSEHSGEE